ncbi:branched-chain amino acid ABC transporter permease [Ramlibacter sp.]|uniref:branched-chain amino acid ABC transporter permease n=1 Tax=Ramlibacter sp. TaxID=1917967 RepID=UPI003D0AB09F
MKTLSSKQKVLIGVAVAVAVALPLFTPDFRLFQASQVLIFAIAILGLNLLTGYNGQLSVGHGAFFAVGAYTTALLMNFAGFPYWATVPAAALVCLAIGFLFGLPALKLDGHYLALATFALALAVPQLLKYKKFSKYTGGAPGTSIEKPNSPFEFELFGRAFNADVWLYLFVLAITVVLFLCAWNLVRGRIGRALVAIRDQPMAAQAMGVNTAIYKSLTFGVSAMYTGIAGALNAITVQYLAPDSFHMFLSVFLLVGMVIGGMGFIPSALFGAVVIVYLPNFAADISKSLPGAIYGVLLILLVYFMPQGIWGALDRLRTMRLPQRSKDAAIPNPGTQRPTP